MKKNSVEMMKKRHQLLVELERKELEKREQRLAAQAEKKKKEEAVGEVKMKKQKFQRHILSRRDYKAERRRARLAKYAPRLAGEDVDMDKRAKNIAPVSKKLRMVKDKSSIRK
jgi:hypothetical protein